MSWEGVHRFECPTRVFFGRGAAMEVGARLAELGVTHALVVSDPGVLGAGIVDTVADAIRRADIGVTVYAETLSNPTTANLEAAAGLFREHGCDGLVGLGGGSSMDAAKGTGILAANGGKIADYAGPDRVREALPPLVCIPTTCGTGSEVTSVAVITDPEVNFKLVCVSPLLAAEVALIDAALVEKAPSQVIAATGADALAHAVESYLNRGADPLLDALNIAAIRLIGRYLAPAVHDRDPEAIEHMALASTMTGIAFNMNANAIVHAASTPVTARHHVAHGVANAIFMVPGLEFLLPARTEKLGEIAAALGEDVAGLEPDAAGRRGIEAVRSLLQRIGLPSSLRDVGVDPADYDIPALIGDALKSRNIATNPRPVTPDDLETIYKAVIR